MIYSGRLVLVAVLAAGVVATPVAVAERHKVKVVDDVGGVCPSGFIVVSDVSGHPDDTNKNGVVCATSPALAQPTPKAPQQETSSKSKKPQVEASPKGKPKTNGPEASSKPTPAATEQVSKKPKASLTKSAPAATSEIRRLDIRDDDKGTCPPGYSLVRETIARPEDQNRNRLVCVRIK